MTRKDFVLIAATVKDCKPTDGLKGQHGQWHFMACKFADALRATNPAFDRARFLKACGVETN